MKMRILMIPTEQDTNLKNFVEKMAVVEGVKVDEKLMRDILNDYVEISTSVLDNLPQDMQESAQKYIEMATRRFVINLVTALKVSTVIGTESLDAIETPLILSEMKVAELAFQFIAKIKPQK